jgi:DNA-binding NarL/FixJ family response regulator
MSKIKIFVVDDHEIFRQGIEVLFETSDIAEVVNTASNGSDFLMKLENGIPDVVLMDIRMPMMDGIETTKRAIDKYPEIKIVALSMFGEEEYLESMLNAGAKGFLVKNTGMDELERAVKTVHQGRSYFSSELLSILMDLLKNPKKDEEKEDLVQFSKRELEILQLVCDGYTNQEIADELFISQRTVDGHRANIISKAGVKNTAHLVTFAIKNGYYTL